MRSASVALKSLSRSGKLSIDTRRRTIARNVAA
jgi:hypothetical protein